MYVFMIRRDMARASYGLSLVKEKVHTIWLRRNISDVIVAINAFDGSFHNYTYRYISMLTDEKVNSDMSMLSKCATEGLQSKFKTLHVVNILSHKTERGSSHGLIHRVDDSKFLNLAPLTAIVSADVVIGRGVDAQGHRIHVIYSR